MTIVLPGGALSANALSADALSGGALSQRYMYVPFAIPTSLSIILKYNIMQVNNFTSFLDSNTIIAGSFALASYFAQEEIEIGFEPNDIDIFVSTEKVGGVDNFIEQLTVFMSGAEYTAHEDGWGGGDYDVGTEIKRVISFKNRAINKKIQIIVVETLNLTLYIKTFFDLSVCATWWNSTTNRFETLDPEYTKRKEMYILDSCEEIIKIRRIQKYTDRGFRIIRKPCIVISYRDPRLDIDSEKFNDIIVHNIVTLEDIPIRDFLHSTEWNIILKSGEQYYGFDRNELVKCMVTKKTYVRCIDDEVYETPFKQCITTEAFTYLGYGDYTI